MNMDHSIQALEHSLVEFQPEVDRSNTVKKAMQFVEDISNLETELANAHEEIQLLRQQLADSEAGCLEDRAKFQSVYQRLKDERDSLLGQRDYFERGYHSAKETLETLDRTVARQLATMRQAYSDTMAQGKLTDLSPPDNGEPIPKFLREPINLSGKVLPLGRPQRGRV